MCIHISYLFTCKALTRAISYSIETNSVYTLGLIISICEWVCTCVCVSARACVMMYTNPPSHPADPQHSTFQASSRLADLNSCFSGKLRWAL